MAASAPLRPRFGGGHTRAVLAHHPSGRARAGRGRDFHAIGRDECDQLSPDLALRRQTAIARDPTTARGVRRASGGRKAARAADSLDILGRRLRKSDDNGLSTLAASLLATFDGGAAAPGQTIDFHAIPSDQSGPSEKKALKRLPKEIKKIRPLHKLLSTSDRGLFIGIQAIDAAGKMGWSTMG